MPRKNARPNCSVDGCERPNAAHLMCHLHLYRFKTYGDVHYGEPEYRYHHGYDRRGPDECWPWKLGRHRKGYGKFKVLGKTWVASRYGWTLANGPIPDGLNVCHTCDNPPCQNPRHWFLGTHKENAEDKVRKGRLVANPYRDAENRFATEEDHVRILPR